MDVNNESFKKEQYTLFVYDGDAESYQDIAAQQKQLIADVQAKNSELAEKDKEIDFLLQEMAELIQEDVNIIRINKGKKMTEVSPRQARRKLAQCKTHTQHALWFCESFGLIPEVLQLRREDSSSPISFQLSSSNVFPNQHLTETGRSKIYQALYISDRFAVSDEAYDELSTVSSLTPLYKIKDARLDLNETLDIRRIEGPVPGAYKPFQMHWRMNY